MNRPVLRYYGGKFRDAPWIIAHFPEHTTYVEPYGGGGSVLMQKRRTYAEIYNDLDGEVVNVFRVLRDPAAACTLRALLELTPFAREEFVRAYEPATDPIERARNTLIRSFMGFGSNGIFLKTTGFRAATKRSGSTPAQDWSGYPDEVPLFVERLKGVVIENRDAMHVMEQQDSPGTLFYVDPPYPHATRNGKKDASQSAGLAHQYRYEMTDQDHVDLATFLRARQGRVIVSGYDCDLYRTLFGDWQRVEKKSLADGARARVEVLWLSPNLQAASAGNGKLF